ncbi:MAG TPA: alkaline phosphatase PhoX [Gemmatimonadaceae bacterium]|nr:alkaline phosphatase PhoX [Gemmatimonadaceae bacterium]
MSTLDRRRFLQRSATLTGGIFLAPSLEGLVHWSRDAAGLDARRPVRRAYLGDGGYGPLREAGQDLDLPDGFTYVVIGTAGTTMSDGNPTPAAHDGMAAFPMPNGNVRLVRNHEVRFATPEWAGRNLPRRYDAKGGGGTVSLEVRIADGRRELVRDFVSLSGTAVNCAGGPTPWGSWLTCEETTQGPSAGFEKAHGYVFEVSALAETPVEPVPLKAMGRFVHEAVAVDPRTGIVYETEDMTFSRLRGTPGAGFYRFIPRNPGVLAEGGRLQMVAVRGSPNHHTFTLQAERRPLRARWVDIDDPDPARAESDPSAVSRQGFAKGAAVFQRLEGCWFGDGVVLFHATNGGDAGKGQVWQYRPDDDDDGELTLLFESPGSEVLDHPDNITVSPRGGIVLCEDGDADEYLRGLTRDGRIFDFARNRSSPSEFAGACFSPDGNTLFVNVQGDNRPGGIPGRTYAIWGPWERGAL